MNNKNKKNNYKKIDIEPDNLLIEEYRNIDDDELDKEIEELRNKLNNKNNSNMKNNEFTSELDQKKKALFNLLLNAKKTDSMLNDNLDTLPDNIIIEDDYNNNNFNKRDINKVIEDKQNRILNIISNELTEKECYNDYMIRLENPITLKDLSINNISLPMREEENITENNNKLVIEIGDLIKKIELEPNYYNRNELIEFLNEGFSYNNIAIECKINDEDKFIFSSLDNKKFTMKSNDDSILPYLGFNKSTYFNKTIYEPENSINIGDNIFYLVIENISDNPMFLINMDLKQITKLLSIDIDENKTYILDHLIIKFYRSKNNIIKNNNEYSFFFENKHEIQFAIMS
jgi:hypothetical protein